jgi:hypothetical protein
MDIAAILRELDAELERLEQVRAILLSIAGPGRLTTKVRKQEASAPEPVAVAQPEPVLTIVPPKVKRVYRPRVKAVAAAVTALAAPLSDKPVFVARAASVAPAPQPIRATEESLEASVRRNLLGSAA